jgi:hypothetical protein
MSCNSRRSSDGTNRAHHDPTHLFIRGKVPRRRCHSQSRLAWRTDTGGSLFKCAKGWWTVLSVDCILRRSAIRDHLLTEEWATPPGIYDGDLSMVPCWKGRKRLWCMSVRMSGVEHPNHKVRTSRTIERVRSRWMQRSWRVSLSQANESDQGCCNASLMKERKGAMV